jgi:integrase/recombinase XerD
MSSKPITTMAANASIIMNSQRLRKDGTCAIYLQVIINREIKRINLDCHWYPDRFKEGRCTVLSKSDRSADDINLILSDAMAKATEIFVQYRLRRTPITMDAFLREYKTNMNKDDFLAYYEWKMMQRLKEGEIEYSSKQSHLVTLNHLRSWKKTISFSELDDRFAFRFDKWMDKHTNIKSQNAKWGQHRNIKTYLNAAKRDRIEFIHPYDYFKAKTVESRFQPLTQEQFLYIWRHYLDRKYVGTEREVVRAFLFCCLTGMRHGDARRASMEWIDGDFLDFVPYKTRKHGTRVRVPISPEALNLMAEEMIETRKESLFATITEQKQNEIMREIGKELHLKVNLCFQIARETFATLYMENDGKLEVLASFLGHTSTKMSEKYVKIRDARKKSEMERISTFIKKAAD